MSVGQMVVGEIICWSNIRRSFIRSRTQNVRKGHFLCTIINLSPNVLEIRMNYKKEIIVENLVVVQF